MPSSTRRTARSAGAPANSLDAYRLRMSHVSGAPRARACQWLGRLPARYALEQEDAIRHVANQCGYSRAAVERAFRARYWASERQVAERRRGIETA